METPPRERKPSALPPKQLHARLKMQMDGEAAGDAHPEIERMGDEASVHDAALKRLPDDFDDQDLD